MRTLYVLRVTFLSIEALVLMATTLGWVSYQKEFQAIASSLEVDSEMLKYLMFLPTGLAVWIFNEVRVLLQEDKETIRILTEWEDYWRLKVHTWLSLFYALVFAVLSLLPWVFKGGISTGIGLLLFIASIVGQSSLAVSIYTARIGLKEMIAHVKV